jgi:putative acyl-CoA dehydrogenase
MEREGAGWARAELHELGLLAGAAGTQELARLANVHGPVLRTHDARGHRIDEVDFHPAWHELMATAVRHGLHAAPWADERPGTHVARAARFFVWTQAEAGHGGYRLTGHKWFCSAPMCDLFLVLAQAPEGLSCFLLPRIRPDGSRNDMRIQRLKDKLGNRSNASAEVEYDGALAWLVGEPGRGIATIIEMVSATRLDCVLGSAAQMRLGCVTAADYVAQRQAFGSALIDYPLMASVIADLTLESEAATTLAIRLAGAADRAARGDAAEADFLRLALPAAKYWVCKRTPLVTGEALECLGGNGYVEDSPMPRLYRDAPLYSIWEGSGNITALDVLRALTRTPQAAEAVLAEIDEAAGADRRLDRAAARLREDLAAAAKAGAEGTYQARRIAGLMALVLQAALLTRHAPAPVADAFCASRLDPEAAAGLGGPGGPFGTLPDGVALADVLGRSSVPTSR